MPLTWNAGDIENYEQLHSEEEGGWPVTEALIFMTMPIGIHKITEATVDEFIRRATIWQATVGGAMYQYGVNDVFITPDEIRARIGLQTNASSRTKTQFHKLIIDKLEERGRRRVRNQPLVLEQAKADLEAERQLQDS